MTPCGQAVLPYLPSACSAVVGKPDVGLTVTEAGPINVNASAGAAASTTQAIAPIKAEIRLAPISAEIVRLRPLNSSR